MRLDIQILKQFFPSILFSTADCIHLTFDDGPHPIATPIVLKELRSRNIRATFFLLGQNVQKYPDLIHQIHSEGHQIGNHSFTHTNLFLKNKTLVHDEILRAKEILEASIGTHSQYFRPPYGYFDLTTLHVLRELGLNCVLWDVDSKDYKLNSPIDISNRVNKKINNGSILLLHDNDETSQKIDTYLPLILDILQKKEFTLKTL